jgi:hypothetical protein
MNSGKRESNKQKPVCTTMEAKMIGAEVRSELRRVAHSCLLIITLKRKEFQCVLNENKACRGRRLVSLPKQMGINAQ